MEQVADRCGHRRAPPPATAPPGGGASSPEMLRRWQAAAPAAAALHAAFLLHVGQMAECFVSSALFCSPDRGPRGHGSALCAGRSGGQSVEAPCSRGREPAVGQTLSAECVRAVSVKHLHGLGVRRGHVPSAVSRCHVTTEADAGGWGVHGCNRVQKAPRTETACPQPSAQL